MKSRKATHLENMRTFEVSFDGIYTQNHELDSDSELRGDDEPLFKYLWCEAVFRLGYNNYVILAPYEREKITKLTYQNHPFLVFVKETKGKDFFFKGNDPRKLAVEIMEQEGFKLLMGHFQFRIFRRNSPKVILFDIEAAREEIFNRFRWEYQRSHLNTQDETPCNTIPENLKAISLNILLNDMAVFEYMVSRFFQIFNPLNDQEGRLSGMPKPVYVHRTFYRKRNVPAGLHKEFYSFNHSTNE